MRRAGGWILGFCIVAAMAGGGWLAFRPILNRETIYIHVTRNGRDPSSDAMTSGLEFALQEAGHRSGAFRVEFLQGTSPTKGSASISITMEPWSMIEAKVHEPLSIASTGIHDVDELPYPIRVVPGLQQLGLASALWVLKSGQHQAVLLFDEKSPRSEEVARGFDTVGAGLKLRLDADVGGDPATRAMRQEVLIDRVLVEKPDLVFYAGEEAPYSRGFELFEIFRRKGFAGKLMMADADPEVSFLAVPAKVVEGTLLVSPISPPSREFASAYEPATGRHAGPHAWPGYLTMKEILIALEHAQSSAPGHLIDAFNQAASKPRDSALYVFRGGKFEFVQDLK